MRRWTSPALALTLLLGLLSARLLGQESSDPQSIIDGLEELDRALLESARQEEQARLDLDKAGAQVAALEEQERRVSLALEERRGVVRARVRALYKYSGRGLLRAVLGGGGSGAMMARTRYLLFIVSRDMALLEAQRADLDKQRALLGELRTRRTTLAQLAVDSQRQRAELVTQRERKNALLTRLQREASLRQRVEEKANAQREGLGERVTSLGTGAAKAKAPPPTLPGGSFEVMKGRLPFPTSGKVVRTFGRYQLPGMMAPVFSKGLEITAPSGTPFKAIYDGKVQMADWFKGYGLMIILDHGGDWRSIYTHASRLLVKVGDQVETGDVIGLVGDTGSLKGPYLYLEVRQGKTPVNPMEWIVVPPDALAVE